MGRGEWGRGLVFIAFFFLFSPNLALGDDEFDLFLAEQGRLIADVARPMADRERIARNLAATLDRAAKSSESEVHRRERWAQAVALLDDFNRKEPGHPEADAFALQAAVYIWAEARSWLGQAESDRGGEPARRAQGLLDDAIGRLGRVLKSAGRAEATSTTWNARFRLAQAIEDRAEQEPRGSEKTRVMREKALEALGSATIDDRSLKGVAELLRARLLVGLGRFDEANGALDLASKADPAPAADALREVRVETAIGRSRFDEAWDLIRNSGLAEAPRELLAVRVRLAEAAIGPEIGRAEALNDAFRRTRTLRKDGRPESRTALLALDRALPEPGPELGPESLDILADGRLLAGDPIGAARLEDRAADRAEGLGKKEQAASLRYRAGAIRYRAGDDRGAEAAFSRVVADPAAGGDRPRAGLLRALARGRLVAEKKPGATEESYARALADQIRDFPGDPTTDEARWLLGLVHRASGDTEAASALWLAIPRDRPRGLDARLALAEFREQEVASHRLDPEPAEGRRLIEEARSRLTGIQDQTRDPSQAAEVELARARLELIPGLGRPDEAQAALDRALAHPHSSDLDHRAKRLRVVALALSGRYLDAEQVARAEAAESSPFEALALARDLDRAASGSDSDVERRRIGGIIRLVLQPVFARTEAISASDRVEARLRDARARYLGGDPEAARLALKTDPSLDPARIDPAFLADLAELAALLKQFSPSLAAYRRLASLARPGSPPWFEARLGQASALMAAGQPRDALRLIEATRILHPNLGGGAIRTKFEKLEKRGAKSGER